MLAQFSRAVKIPCKQEKCLSNKQSVKTSTSNMSIHKRRLYCQRNFIIRNQKMRRSGWSQDHDESLSISQHRVFIHQRSAGYIKQRRLSNNDDDARNTWSTIILITPKAVFWFRFTSIHFRNWIIKTSLPLKLSYMACEAVEEKRGN